MGILTNAINSIQVGIEDYEASDDRRHASAIRNIYAGILLLYKEKLCRLSPSYDRELLIRRNLRPIRSDEGGIIFHGVGRATVNVAEIKDRFDGLGVSVDWKRFDKLSTLRNELEHYYASQSSDILKEAISESFLLIRNFIANELSIDPQECIGSDTWNTLLGVAEVYDAEKLACNESISKCDWKYGAVEYALKYLRCPECGSALIFCDDAGDEYPEIRLSCKSCGNKFSFASVVEECVEASLGVDAHMALKEGDQPPYDTCPECGRGAFVYEEGCCVACGYEMEYDSCEQCGERLTLDEQWLEGKCSYCQHRWEKIMAE